MARPLRGGGGVKAGPYVLTYIIYYNVLYKMGQNFLDRQYLQKLSGFCYSAGFELKPLFSSSNST